MRDRTAAVVVVALLVLWSAFIFDHDAWTPDEPRVVELCRSVSNGSWVVPYLNDEPFLEQPVFHEWCVAGSYALLGPNAGAARLVSALAGLLTLAVTYLIGERLAGKRAGALSAAVLGVTFGFWFTTHRIVCDGVLAFFVAASGYASLRGLTATTTRERLISLAFAYALASLAFLTKNVVGVCLAGVGFLAVAIALRDPRSLLRGHLWLAPLAFAVVCGPYLYRVWEEVGPAGLKELVVENTLGRALATREGGSHAAPFWYYLVHFPLNSLPGGLFFLGGIAFFLRRPWKSPEERLAHHFPLWWVALGVAGLSLARGKRELYVVPLYPAAAVVGGVWLDRVLSGEDSSAYAKLLPRAFAILLGLVGVAAPIVAVVVPALRQAAPLAALGALPALAGAAATFALARRWDRPGAPWASLLLGFAGSFAIVIAAFAPIVDAEKRLGPFLEAVGRTVPRDRALFVLRADETLRGAVNFYARRPALLLEDDEDEKKDAKAELRARIRGQRDVWVLVFEKRKGDPNYESVRDLDPEVVLEEKRSRTLRLLRFRAN